ncbi:MAG: hypothetical protein HOP03_09295 [Lysobacter sp.]|nr:hypothetical protein [Lysobacter sp.]
MSARFALMAGVFVMLFATLVLADSWPPPRTQRYYSADGNVQIVIVPRALAGNLEYFQDKVDGKSPAGQRPGSNIMAPFARVSRRTDGGRWTTLWQQSLVNDVAPVHAMAANNGKYLVTFDNWHSMGHGTDAVAIYGTGGRLIRKYALTDFLPRTYIETLPASVSSIRWGREHFFSEDEETLILRVAEPSFDFGDDHGLVVSIRIRLADGAITPPAGRAWERALRKSKKVRAQQQAFERKACAEWGGGWCRQR